MKTPWPNPDSRIATEFALGSDGVLYVTVEGRNPEQFAGRAMFVGRALRRAELEQLGVRGVLVWATFARLALGSDGRVYVAEDELDDPRGRKAFRGYATTPARRARVVEELHRLAWNALYVR
jgi:hypothetical protein